MAGWALQGVFNVGVQILLLVVSGWCFARFGLLSAEAFMGQINVLVLRAAFPSLMIYLLGIKVDLKDTEAWKSLGSYVLWVALVQAGITCWAWLSRGHNSGRAAVINLVLTANNTVIVGLPVMQATFPDAGARLSLLSAFVLFLQVIPYSITAFEIDKWVTQQQAAEAEAAEVQKEVLTEGEEDPEEDPDSQQQQQPLSGPTALELSERRQGVGGSAKAADVSGYNGDGKCGDDGGGSCGGKGRCITAAGEDNVGGAGGGIGGVGVGAGGGSGRSGSGTPTGSDVSSRTSSKGCTAKVPEGTCAVAAAEGAPVSAPLPRIAAAVAPEEEVLLPPPPPSPPLPLPPAPGSVTLAHLDRAASCGAAAVAAAVDVGAGAGAAAAAATPAAGGCDSAGAMDDEAARGTVVAATNPASTASRGGGVVSPFAVAAAAVANPAASVAERSGHCGSPADGCRATHATATSPPTPPETTPSPQQCDLTSAATNGTAATAVVHSVTAYRTSSSPVPGVEAHIAPPAAMVRQGMRFRGQNEALMYRKAAAAAAVASAAANASGGGGGSRSGSVKGGTVAVSGPMGHKPHDGGGSPPHQAINRQSLPVHWPPVALDVSASDVRQGEELAAAGGYGSTTAGSPPPGLGGSRLLSPTALACADLPVPQAMSLARSTAPGPFSASHHHTTAAPAAAGANKACAVSNLSAAAGKAAGVPTTAPSSPAYLPSASVLLAPPPASPSPHPKRTSPPPSPPLGAVPGGAAGGGLERPSVLVAVRGAVRRQGGWAAAVSGWLLRRLRQYRQAAVIAWIVAKNPLLWSLLVALVINLSGLRSLLLPTSPHYRPELGWVAGALSWASGITVPVSLFSNGVWLHGKRFSREMIVKACLMQAFKLAVLAPLQLACAAACRLAAPAAISILLLSLCPVASTSFVIAVQYGQGAELVTAATLLGTVLLVPAMVAGLELPRVLGLYDFSVASSSS